MRASGGSDCPRPLPPILAPVAAFAVALLTLRVLLLPALGRRMLDQPNARSLHVRPVPRTGGLALTAGAVSGIAIAEGPAALVAGAVVLMSISLFDDWKSLGAGVRLAGHLAVAATFVALAGTSLPAWMLAALVLAVAWMINLYNFMDGADGLAGGMAVIGFATYAIAALGEASPALGWSAAAVAAAAAAFLLHNFPPARIFLGDGGSVPLGFLAAALGICGWTDGAWPLWFPAVVFAPFVVDASVTLLRRLLRGEKVWQAHRSHYYQRLVLMGWSHRRLALAAYACMLLSSAVALWAAGKDDGHAWSAIAALAGVYAVLGAAIDSRWKSHAHI